MKYLYLDEFRGFSDTIIPLRKVNFLVGENSTGKSSILSLLNLIHDFNFWVQQEFNNDLNQFGGFKDIVSASSKAKTHFRIGILSKEGECTPESGEGSCTIITFKSKEGIPDAFRYTYVEDGKLIHIQNNSNGYTYKIDDLHNVCGTTNISLPVFEKLVSLHKKPSPGFKKLKLPMGVPRSAFLIHIPSLIKALFLKKKKNDENPLAFRLPVIGQPTWIAPIRTKPKRTYDGYQKNYSAEGEHTPYVLKKRLANKEQAISFKDSLAKFGKEGGLFDSIKIKKYGNEESSPFEVQVILGENSFRISSVGYGVSQALPIIVELLSGHKNGIFLIQQPEVHLHPRAQAAFGELFSTVTTDSNIEIFVETHSDYTIDRFRIKHREKENPPESQILFFERSDGRNKVTSIEIKKDGSISDQQPDSYRSFFLKEEMQILGL